MFYKDGEDAILDENAAVSPPLKLMKREMASPAAGSTNEAVSAGDKPVLQTDESALLTDNCDLATGSASSSYR